MKIKPEVFEFSSYQFNSRKRLTRFHYKIGFAGKKTLSFTETIILPQNLPLGKIPKGLLNNLLQNLHLILGISYYKLYCPPKIKLAKPISKEQAEFWNTIYKKGLGEFFYRNKINPKIRFPYQKRARTYSFELEQKNRCLVGIGGGKDSIVAAELLKKNGREITALVVETQKKSPIIDAVIKEIGVKKLAIRRMLDEKLFSEPAGAYSGHVPISAIYAFLGLFVAALYDYRHIAVGNEYSSNFGNVEYGGEIINHQWSKSSEFEKLFQDYTKKFITPSIVYFSALRPFYEIRVAEIFAKRCKKYFPYFSSCNWNFKITGKRPKSLWCGECPKCVFSFAVLSPFLSKSELLKIFRKNLFNEAGLLPVFRDLLGFGKLKPFDCVGTPEETRAALCLARKKIKKDLAIKTFFPKISAQSGSVSDGKNPKNLIQKVFRTQSSPTLPEEFKFLGIKNVLILGYGKEGRVTHEYLKKKYPHLKLGVADEKSCPGYLEKQKKYDLAIKTPGMPKKLVTIPYTTATNIFFSKLSAQGGSASGGKNPIIGVTGSKGKSTTASLIYTILKEAGIKTRLLGNIGNPMLEYLLKPHSQKETLVIELSSYQLEDIKFSPHIAVVTNLFPEHMNYHDGVKEYYEAKKNIINFQNKDDFFVYNPVCAKLANWAKTSAAKPISFIKNIPLKNSEIPLVGEHNKENIRAAITVAKILGISAGTIKTAIKKFRPLPHRLELVGEFRGIKFYDDAISTAPESTIAAIKSLPNIKTIFLGGEDRGYDFSRLEKTVKKYGIKNIVLFPNSGKRIFKSAESQRGLNIFKTSSMEEAVKFAYKNTPANAICLLSCASPSYSLWKNFEEKGEQFQHFVKKYT